MQVTPFPEYPVLQAQVNDPGVLVHVAVPDAQFEVPAVHSLMSIPIQRAFRHKETKAPRKEEKKKKKKELTSASNSIPRIPSVTGTSIRANGVRAGGGSTSRTAIGSLTFIDICGGKRKRKKEQIERKKERKKRN